MVSAILSVLSPTWSIFVINAIGELADFSASVHYLPQTPVPIDIGPPPSRQLRPCNEVQGLLPSEDIFEALYPGNFLLIQSWIDRLSGLICWNCLRVSQNAWVQARNVVRRQFLLMSSIVHSNSAFHSQLWLSIHRFAATLCVCLTRNEMQRNDLDEWVKHYHFILRALLTATS